jgi:hypothetical protein
MIFGFLQTLLCNVIKSQKFYEELFFFLYIQIISTIVAGIKFLRFYEVVKLLNPSNYSLYRTYNTPYSHTIIFNKLCRRS